MRWGILGTSSFALNAMGPAIHAARGAELVAVASRDASKVAPFQAWAPMVRACSYEEILAAPDIDAVYVPLPNHLHVPWALKILEAGKHVLVEKPVGMSVAEVDQLIAARDASGRMAAEAFMIAHHPQWARVRELLADGAVGTLRHVQAHFAYDNSGDPANVRNQRGMGGGALRDIGVYTIGSVQLALGEGLTDVRARMNREGDFDLTTHVTGRIAGATYDCYVSMRMMRAQGVRFHGTEGEIVVPAPFNPPDMGEARVELHRPTSIEVDRFPTARQYVIQVEAFRAAADGADYAWPLERARQTQATLDEVMRVAEDL
ncbi:MAG: Gfo/Idh/MocA family protein [Shimia sp.]